MLPLALGLLVAGKILATSFTLGSGGSGGVFAPSLFIGAMFGGAFGHAVATLFPQVGVSPGAYAVVGMGVVFAGGTWAAMSAILILFEMTHDYGLILPMMIACVTATIVARRLSADNIYTLKLRRRGIDLEESATPGLAHLQVMDIMTRDPETIPADMPLSALLRRVERAGHSGFPVVDGDGALKGLITYAELRDAVAVAGHGTDFIIASDVMRPFQPVIGPDAAVDEAVEKMRSAGVRRLAVVGPRGGLVGIVTNHDIVTALARAGRSGSR
jgi:CIC family chloride channel protein